MSGLECTAERVGHGWRWTVYVGSRYQSEGRVRILEGGIDGPETPRRAAAIRAARQAAREWLVVAAAPFGLRLVAGGTTTWTRDDVAAVCSMLAGPAPTPETTSADPCEPRPASDASTAEDVGTVGIRPDAGALVALVLHRARSMHPEPPASRIRDAVEHVLRGGTVGEAEQMLDLHHGAKGRGGPALRASHDALMEQLGEDTAGLDVNGIIRDMRGRGTPEHPSCACGFPLPGHACDGTGQACNEGADEAPSQDQRHTGVALAAMMEEAKAWGGPVFACSEIVVASSPEETINALALVLDLGDGAGGTVMDIGAGTPEAWTILRVAVAGWTAEQREEARAWAWAEHLAAAAEPEDPQPPRPAAPTHVAALQAALRPAPETPNNDGGSER